MTLEVNNVIERMKNIKSKYVTLYPDFDKKIVLKHSGKIPGVIDPEYISFLKYTNGASILDYCFFGLKNNKLGSNVYDAMTELWFVDNLLALRFWGVVATSTGEYFGYLDKQNESGGYFWGYYAFCEPGKVYCVASSFLIFMDKFLTQIEAEVSKNDNALGLSDNSWFLDINLLVENDPEMQRYILENDGNSEYLSTIYK